MAEAAAASDLVVQGPHVLREDLEVLQLMAGAAGIEPLTLVDFVPKDFNFFRRRLESLVESHGTRRIVAIAHQDCAWYKAHRIGPLTIDLRGRQIRDLRRASARLRQMFGDIVVETYYARLAGTTPERVVFEKI